MAFLAHSSPASFRSLTIPSTSPARAAAPSRHGASARRWGRAALAVMGAVLLAAVPVRSTLAAEASAPVLIQRTPDKSDAFFESGRIPELKIELAATNLARLRRDPRGYVRATVRDGDKAYADVGIHVKGAAGSSRSIDDNPALTLNFDKFRDGQKFNGLDKLHLNNSVQDGSLMSEAICSDLFLAAGVPTARTGHARVWLNGRDLGLYVLKEGYDRSFLRRHFANPRGNLYDGGFLREITEPLQRDAGDGDVEGYRDLRAVAAAAREPDFAKRMGRLEQVLDVDRFLSFVALEILTWHWDGYAMKHNNYRVYHDPGTGRCVFIPHGMDQMFWDAGQPLAPPNMEGLVARAVLETAEGRQRYRQRVTSIASNLFTAERLTNHLNRLEERLRPVLTAISTNRAREQAGAAQNLRSQILARVRRVHELIALPVPEPVQFDPAGVARLERWSPFDLKATGLTDEVEIGGVKALHIAAGPGGKCTASWRFGALLPRGRYVFEARLRTAGVVGLTNEPPARGAGAGIRVSRPTTPRANVQLGDQDWKPVSYEFTVEGEDGERELVCELRAARGEAWFDRSSLRLRRLPRVTPAPAGAPGEPPGTAAPRP